MARRLHLAVVCLLLISAPLVMAMGMGDSEGPTRIPEPEANYRARVTDLEGVSVDLTQFSIDGQIFFLGNLGDGNLAVPFDKFTSVELVKQGEMMRARLTMNQEKPVELTVKPGLKLYGKTQYGNFRIELGQVKQIQLQGKVK